MRLQKTLQAFWNQLKSKRQRPKKTSIVRLTLEHLEDRITPTNLFLIGDQLGSGYNDTISIDVSKLGGVFVNMNDQVSTFSPGTIDAIYIFPEAGNNTVNILNTGVPVFIASDGYDTVNIGTFYGGVQGIAANVVVSNSGFYTALNIDDGADPIGRTGYISENSVSGLAPGTIFYQGNFSSLNVFGGSGGNTFYVVGTSILSYSTSLQTGTGNDFVNVQATTGYFYVNNNGGTDSVKISSLAPFLGGTLENIHGPVDVYGAGSTYLLINNSGKPGSFWGATIKDGEISGLSPAPIFWTSSSMPTGGVIRVDVIGGLNILYNVRNTSDLYEGTFINMGDAENTGVIVTGTTGPLYVNGSGPDTFVSIGYLVYSLEKINGPITVWSDDSDIRVVIWDQDDTIDRTATLGPQTLSGTPGPINTLSGLSPAPINIGYDFGKGLGPLNVLYLQIFGGSGANTYNIVSTEGITSDVLLTMGSGNDAVNVQATTGSLGIGNLGGNDTVTIGSLAPTLGGTLANINGPITVDTFHDSISVVADDSGDSTGRTATLSDQPVLGPMTTLTGLSPAPIGLGFNQGSDGTFLATNLTILGGSGANSYNIQGTAGLSSSVVVQAGSGNDIVNVGSGGSTSTLDAIQASVTINSQTSLTALNINDQGSTTGHAYTLTSTTLSRSGAALITYDPVTSLTINAGSGDDSLTVVSTAPGTPVTFNGDGGNNTVTGPNVASTFNIGSPNGGTVGNVTFGSVQNLTGGSANDTFAFRTGGSLAGNINGGGGSNTLDYSAYVGNIGVIMPLAKAGLVAGSIAGIQNVRGSIGNDLLVGDANANLLVGGTGRNLIIGGGGPDQITGGGGDNILIGGTTLWDTNPTALLAIINEWINPSLRFDQRVNALRTGIVVGGKTYALNSSTVHADSSPDSLIGGGGRNWFFVDFDDIIDNGAGPGPNDRVTRV